MSYGVMKSTASLPRRLRGCRAMLVIESLCLGLGNFCVCRAEVALDGTLGPMRTLAGPDYRVTDDLGRQVGGNLFHSFSDFNLNRGESATFSGPASVQNILARVTGGRASSIAGKIASTVPGANLYFLNPAGVIFREGAALEVDGSLTVTTANYLKLGE